MRGNFEPDVLLHLTVQLKITISLLQVHLVEIDIEQDPKIAEAAGVQSTPTVQMFKDKERIQHLPGVKMKSDYRKFINEGLGEKVKVPA